MIDPVHTAVLSMDCQAGIVSIYTREAKAAYLARVASVLNHARAAGITVIHIQVGFDRDCRRSVRAMHSAAPLKSSEQHQRLFWEPLGAIPDVKSSSVGASSPEGTPVGLFSCRWRTSAPVVGGG